MKNKGRMACVVCGCTQERGCPGGCSWVTLKHLSELNCDGPLCTTCGTMVARLVMYSEDVYRFRLAPLMRAVKAAGAARRFTVNPTVRNLEGMRKARAVCG
jgi:hypothetical protein